MFRQLYPALMTCLVSFVVCGVAYPAAVYVVGRLAFPTNAEGRLVKAPDGTVVGSDLIAQAFTQDRYFHPRPSAAGADGYAADAASGSNLGSKNPALRQRIVLDSARLLAGDGGDAEMKGLLARLDEKQGELKDRAEKSLAVEAVEAEIASLRDAIGKRVESTEAATPIPVDLVTASGSGLDPDISPEAARYQARRVSEARKLPIERVMELIEGQTDRSGALLGVTPSVNVLRLNLSLDRISGDRD